MALSGSVRTNPYVYKGTDSYGNAITGQVGLECRWTATQDIAANKSIISWTLISYGDDFTFVTGNVKLDINNARVLQIDSRFDLRGAGYWSRTGTLEVLHEADGSKDFTISISAGIWYYTSSNCTGTDTFTLDPIGRSSSATVPNFTIGTGGSIAISRANNSFTHRLSVKLGGSVIEIASGVGTSYQWTPDANTWGKLIPNATSAACTMVLETYNGSTKIGDSKSYPFTLYVPASYVPSVTSLAVSLVNDNATVKSWGVAVKGFTKLSWATQAVGSYGSTITGYTFTAGGMTVYATSGTTGILQTAGSIIPSFRVTDSRGRKASLDADPIEVFDYAAPNVANAAAYRCDKNGNANADETNVRITLTAKISSVGGKNSATLKYRYKPVGGSYTGWTTFTSGAILTGFDAAKSYEFELQAVDALGKAKSATVTVPTEGVWLNGKDGGKGAAFGKYAEEDDLFDVAWRSRFRGAVTFDTRPAQLAPSGFGLGEKAPKTPWANVDSLLLSGWYRFDETENPTPGGIAVGGITATYAYMRVDGYNENNCFQTLYPFGFNGSRLSRAMVNGAWEEWGWENPPMTPGVEYRTTERWNGRPVYTKLVNGGAIAASGSFSTGIYNARIVDAKITLANMFNGYHDPTLGTVLNPWDFVAWTNLQFVWFTAGSDLVAGGGDIYALMKYVYYD